MICPNCGKECTEDEYFCRKCGTKVGNFQFVSNNEEKVQDDYSETSGFNNIVGGIPEKEMPEDDLGKTIDTSHILDNEEVTASFKDPSKEKPIELGSVDDDFGMIDDDDQDAGKNYESSSVEGVKPEKKKKTKLIVICVLAAVLVAILGTIGVIYATKTSKFNKFYSAGTVLYNQKNYSDARTQYIQAASNAFTSGQKIKAYKMVYATDEMLGGYDKEEIAYMEALVDLDDDNIEFYKNLIILYQNNGLDSKIGELISSAPKDIQDKLKDFDGTIPTVNYPEGKYAKPLEIELSATDGVKIYYTLDGSKVEDSQTRKEYKKPFMLSDEGQYNLRAASKSKNGKFSKEFQGKYELDFGSVKEPSVNLDSGKYTEQKKIKVTCDPGCTIYYTKDGTTPTEKSKKYKKAIKMPKGTSLYYFVAVNKDGISSGVITRAYDYSPDFSFSYDEALNALSSNLVSNNIFESKDGTFKNKNIGYLNYKSVEEMDGAFYYVIQVEICDKNGKTKSTSYYGVSTDSGHVEKVNRSGGKYSIE
ncbi:MAG: chitobiase/beta-hexosaminidase C-terminal domain-containing protein [Eubacterium sp.]|nr:chitobiase/beta-hexosaminidase C-terminal domain-containing protein [Eubacterium sp.]